MLSDARPVTHLLPLLACKLPEDKHIVSIDIVWRMAATVLAAVFNAVKPLEE